MEPLLTGQLLTDKLVELKIAPAVLAGAVGTDIPNVKGNVLAFDVAGIVINPTTDGNTIAVGAKFFPWTSVLDLTLV